MKRTDAGSPKFRLAYGDTEAHARAHAVSLALRAIADRIDNGEPLPEEARDLFAA